MNADRTPPAHAPAREDRAARSAVVIRNPAARRAVPRAALEAAARTPAAHGWRVTVEESTSAAGTRALAAQHARAGVDAILACGGDGTLAAVLNGVREVDGCRSAVGVVPAGTANVWAGEAGVPRDPRAALALLDGGARRRVDLGVVRLGVAGAEGTGGTEGTEGAPLRFLLVCGVGMDGAVVRAVEGRARWKRAGGRLAYALPALAAGLRWPPTAARVTVDGVERRHERLLLALAANTRRYGGVAAIAGAARVDDGRLDLVTFEAAGGWRSLPQRAALALAALRGGLAERAVAGIAYRRGAHITIEPQRRLPVQADGEAIGWCGPGAPLRIDVEPAAVTMIVGERPSPLWGAPA